jgi:hypothetical protein
MCEYETFQHICGHVKDKLYSYCHFARNDQSHQCFGVKVIKGVWQSETFCKDCMDAMRAAAIQSAQGSGGQGSQR